MPTPDQGTYTNELRTALLEESAGFIVTAGYVMAHHAQQTGDQAKLAVGTAVQICGDLSRGILRALSERHYYTAAAAARQLLECNDLIHYLGRNPSRAVFWMTADDEKMRKAADFTPTRMRGKAGSSEKEYAYHCHLGGHPRSIARILLPNSPYRARGAQIPLVRNGKPVHADLDGLLLSDALQHVYDAVTNTIEVLDLDAFRGGGALRRLGVTETGVRKKIDSLVVRLCEWRAADPLAETGRSWLPDDLTHLR
ncbi:hypothetical protein [Actinomadura geliboluensis]|uniref:hypothetical protein n=1 Tax=Actinomadura geliboluensis TaxID=882440 RepID=UPI003716CCD3